MKMRPVATSSTARKMRASGSCAFVAQTNADHAHQTSARTSIARPKPAQSRSRRSNVVTCVTAKTKTRSHRSSIGVVRRSATTSAMGGEYQVFTPIVIAPTKPPPERLRSASCARVPPACA